MPKEKQSPAKEQSSKEKQVLIVTGYARSGKDTVADYLKKRHGFKKIVFSEFVAKELVKRKIDPTKENICKYGPHLRHELGESYVIKQVLAQARKFSKVAICSVKPLREYKAIMKEFPKTKMLLVSADPAVRFTRRPTDSPGEFKAFIARDKIDERIYKLKRTFAKRDIEIRNNGTLKELHTKVDAAYKKLFC